MNKRRECKVNSNPSQIEQHLSSPPEVVDPEIEATCVISTIGKGIHLTSCSVTGNVYVNEIGS